MKRRDFFRGLAGTAVALAVKPLMALVPKQPKISFNGKLISVGPMRQSLGAGVVDTVQCVNGCSVRPAFDVYRVGQYVRIFQSDLKYLRGTRRVQAAHDGWLTFDSKVPGGTQAGDLLLIEEECMPCFVSDSRTGEFKGLGRL